MKTILKSAVLIALLLAGPWVSGQGNEPPTGIPSAIEGRIANLELMRENLHREVELHKQELSGEVFKTEVYILLGIATSVLGAGWLFWGVRNLRPQVIAKAEAYLDAELKRQLPVSTRKRIHELFERVIPDEIEPFLKLVRQKKNEDQIKANTKIVLLAENLEKGKNAENDFRESGFKDVSVHVPQSDDLPLASVYVFVRREPKPDEGWSKVSDQFVKRILDQNRKDVTKAFFYYGPYNDALDPKMHPRFGLANMPSTLSSRLIELLSNPSIPHIPQTV